MITLGIETSCDDTSICLLETDDAGNGFPVILAHHSFSQETILQEWGGVVPEIAARNHLAKVTRFHRKCDTCAVLGCKGHSDNPIVKGRLWFGLDFFVPADRGRRSEDPPRTKSFLEFLWPQKNQEHTWEVLQTSLFG